MSTTGIPCRKAESDDRARREVALLERWGRLSPADRRYEWRLITAAERAAIREAFGAPPPA